jgi:hypothetical protein
MASKPGEHRTPGTKARHGGVPSARGRPACCPGGARCRGGVSSLRALAWNRRTCRPGNDGQGKLPRPREGGPQAADTASGRAAGGEIPPADSPAWSSSSPAITSRTQRSASCGGRCRSACRDPAEVCPCGRLNAAGMVVAAAARATAARPDERAAVRDMGGGPPLWTERGGGAPAPGSGQGGWRDGVTG